jgi:hypothetical protein
MDKPILIKPENFFILGYPVNPPKGFAFMTHNETEEKYPFCCSYHKGIYDQIKKWFETFPGCCDQHKALIGKWYFKKENYIDIVEKVMNNLAYTAFLNTLAQSRTEDLFKPTVILRGKGSEITSLEYGNRKGKKKMISQIMARNLIDIAKEKGRDVKPFWNTYHCLNRVFYSNEKIYGNYCKNRFCTVCTAIRKADKINAYYPVLKDWKDAYFVTLTIKACEHSELKKMMKGCIRAIRKIIAKYRKRNQRGNDMPLMGIRSLECNFNPNKKTYNPHFHIIVPDQETALILKKEWLSIWTSKYTYHKGQDIKPVNGLESALLETIKYGSKIFTEPDLNKKVKTKNNVMVYAKAFYNIIEAMSGLRIFERFGFNLPSKDENHSPTFVTMDYQEWEYMPEYHDWQNTENELTLTGYAPEQSLCDLLNWSIDKINE